MKKHVKLFIALASGMILLSGVLGQTAQASFAVEGTSILADVVGVTTPPEALTISWSVVENASGVYTYTYIVNNPAGDVILPGGTTPETVDFFQVDFNATLLGAGNLSGGTGAYNVGNGVEWLLFSPTVAAGTNSGALSFTSYYAPFFGNASASDDNSPSPWASYPFGQQVPVPGVSGVAVTAIPESTTLLAGMLMILPFRSAALRFVRKK